MKNIGPTLRTPLPSPQQNERRLKQLLRQRTLSASDIVELRELGLPVASDLVGEITTKDFRRLMSGLHVQTR